MPLKLNSSGGGSVTLDVPATANTFTVNFPAANGDVVVTGGGSTVQFGAGSASAPSITFSGDTNTGIYTPAADTIAFTEGGTEAMRIDSSGRVGIGTSSPDYLLTLQTADAAISLKDSGGITRAYVGIAGVVGSAPTGALRLRSDQGGIVFVQSGTETARITSGGQFTITSQPSFRVSRSNNTGVSGVVLFDNIYHNIGSHYNSGTGRFTAPVTGSYLLTATGGQSSGYGFDIRVNGTTVSRAELVGVSFGYLWETCCAVVRMNANDYADVNVFSGTPQFEPGFGSFTGQLLS